MRDSNFLVVGVEIFFLTFCARKQLIVENMSFEALHGSETFSSMAELLDFPEDKQDTDYLY